MSLRFIYGKAGFGKSTFCLNDISQKLKNADEKHPLILVVPEQFSFQAEKNLINAVEKDINIRAKVLSFKRMAYRVFAEVGGIGREHMNAAGRAMLIYKLLNELKGELSIFSKAAQHNGFVDTVAEMITELKRYTITPEDLRQAAEQADEAVMKSKLQDIGLIFEKYESVIHQSHIDAEDDMTLLYEKLESSNMFNNAEIYFDEFSSFTPQQYKVIEKLMKKAARINITLTISTNGKMKNTDLFSLTSATEEKLIRLAADNNIAIDRPIDLNQNKANRYNACEDIAHLEEHLYTYPFEEYSKEADNIRLFKAMNVYAEVEELARDISRIIREKDCKLRYRDIVVATRDMPRYESLVRAIFDIYEIPYFIDERRELTGNPLIVMLLSMLEINNKNWSYEAVFRYLKTGMLDIDTDDINIIENYVLSSGIKGNRWFEDSWEFRLNYGGYSNEEAEVEYLSKINVIKNKIVVPLQDFYKNLKQSKNCRDYCTKLFHYMEDNKLDQKLEEYINEYKKNGDIDNANKYSQVWDVIVDVLDQIIEVLGDEEVTLEEFSKLLSIGFSQYTAGLIPSSIDQVLIGSVDRMKSHDIKALYLLGVNDGVFPRAQNDEGILNDKDREKLRDMGLELASSTRSKAFEEQYVIYTTLSAPSCYLRLSYPMANHDGKTLRPSIIVSRIKKLFPKLIEQSNLTMENSEQGMLNKIWAPVPTFNELIGAVRLKMDGSRVEPEWEQVYAWYLQNSNWKGKTDRIMEGLDYNNQAAEIDRERARKIYGKDLLFSVSRLEKYSECPFAYFIKYGLKAKERKIYRATAPDLGTFMHNVLNEFAELLKKENQTWREVDKKFCKDAVEIIVKDMIDQIPGSILNSSERYKFLSQRLKKTLVTALYIVAEHIKKSDFEPKGYEEGFGPYDKYPPIKIMLENGDEISLIGRIDRLDVMDKDDESYVRIIDYKSGNKDIRLTDVYYGLQLQLLTYLDAILEGAATATVENPEDKVSLSPAGILYFKIDDPIVKGDPEITDEQIEKLMMKELKLRGLLLDEIDIIKSMDNEIKGSSTIVPAGINVDGTLSRNSRVASREQFELLRKYVKKTITDIANNMLNGNIRIHPYKKKNINACTYCEYSSVCQFDTTIKDNNYRVISDKGNDDIWNLMQHEVGGDAN